MASKKWAVIVGNFHPGEYGGFRLGGPFSDAAEATAWIEKDVPTHEGLLAEVIELEDPSSMTWPD